MDRFRKISASLSWVVMLLALLIFLFGSGRSGAQGIDTGTAPFTLKGGHILLRVRINGQGPYTFLLDSGAERNVMDKSLAAILGLKTVRNIGLNGFGANQLTVPVTEPAAVAVGASILFGQSFLALDLPGMASYNGLPLQGILGEDVFRSFVVHLDHAHATLTLTPAAQFSYRGHGVVLPITFERHGLAMLSATVNGASGQFEIDTGSNGGVLLYPAFTRQNQAKFSGADSAPIVTNSQVGGETRVALLKSAKVQIGPISAVVSPLELLTTTPPHVGTQDIAGNIGESVLQNFSVTFDFKDKLLILDNPGI